MICCNFPGCAQWSNVPGQHSLFGFQQAAQYNTPSACQTLCINTPTCVAIDFNNVVNSCWLHLSSDDLTLTNTFNDDPSTTQYILARSCSTVVPCKYFVCHHITLLSLDLNVVSIICIDLK